MRGGSDLLQAFQHVFGVDAANAATQLRGSSTAAEAAAKRVYSGGFKVIPVRKGL